VTLASIHAVKGQEWDHVVVHHVSAGLLPHRLVDDVEEERRVLHVAITRGRRSVTVVPGPKPSPFLAELAEPGVPPPPRPKPAVLVPPSPAKPEPVALVGALAEAAFERLRAWRTAKASGKPAYTVFSDATLRDLANALPATEAELAGVKGVGPTKLQLYGDELLGLLEEVRSTTGT
jgi:DNA helicase-2/ATP-dependent DNA helicase PcrA